MRIKCYYCSFVLNVDWPDNVLIDKFKEQFDFNFVVFQRHKNKKTGEEHMHGFVGFSKESSIISLKYFPKIKEMTLHSKTFDYLKWLSYVTFSKDKLGKALMYEKT